MVRSDKLIESGNSWFSPKELLGSRRIYLYGVEHWKVSTGRKITRPIKLRIRKVNYPAVSLWGLSSIGQKGNSPRSLFKVPKSTLSALKVVKFH